MSSHLFRCLLLVAFALPGVARAEVLFHVPFDGDLKPAAAKGEAAPRFTPAAGQPAAPRFAPGIKGQAFDTGTGGRISYPTAGNFHDARGTLTFWVKRTGPEIKDRYTFHLVDWANADGTWVYVYRWEWHAGINVLHGKGGSGDIGVQLPGSADDGAWHFVTFTWEGTHVRGTLDGKSDSAAEKFDFPAQQFRGFSVGDAGGAAHPRLIDEVRVFDEPLSAAEIKAMYRELAGVTTEPALVIPRRAAPVKIDGKIGKEEWAGAAETTGLAGIDSKSVAPTQTGVRLCYDDQALYAALSTPLPEKARKDFAMTAGMTGILRQTRDRFDTDVDHDDCMEINVMPRLPGPGAPAGGTWYRLVANGLNTHYDYSISAADVIALGWNPQWESASTVDANGWQMEVRLPFAGFAAPAPKPGERWGMNFVRIWQALQAGREAWSTGPAGTPGYRYAVAPVEFGPEKGPVVQLSDWGPLSDNLVALHAAVLNPGPTPIRVRCQISSDSGEVKVERALDVPAGGSAPFRADARIEDPETGLLTFTATDEAGKRVLLRSQVPVTVRQSLDIRTAYYPSPDILKVTVDAGRLRRTPLKELSLTLALVDTAGKPVLPERVLQPMPNYWCEAPLKTAGVKPGQYQIRCTIRQAGKTAAERTFPFEKRPLPEWFGNKIGVTDKAPKPFTPVRRSGDTLSVWGREYQWGNSLFPRQVTSQGGKVLAAPIELVVTDTAGKTYRSGQAPATAKWGKHTDFRIEFERSAMLGPVRATASSWLECDGFLWTTLRLPPANATVAKVVVRVPLAKEWSEYINPYDYSTAATGKLKPAGYKGSGSPVWLGNPTGGWQFTTETLAPCRLKADTSPVTVTVGAAANVLELTLIDTPTSLREGFELSWGWVATPTRPRPPDYRGWMTGNCEMFPSYQWYYPKGTDFDPRWLGYSHFVGQKERPDGRGKRTNSGGPYITTGLCHPDVPEFQYWGDEWSPSRLGRKIEGGTGLTSVAARSWVDYVVWCYRQTYQRGRYVGLYYDCAPYYADDNTYHGGGYRKKSGQLVPTHSILGAREIAQRLYCQLREKEPERTMVLYHHSGCVDMAFLSWCDVFVDGENFTSRLSKQAQDYHRVYPPEAFLAQSMGSNFGPAVWFLDEFDRSGATNDEDWKRLGVQPVTHLYGLILLHDSGYWKAYGNPEGYKMVDEALMKYHFDERFRMIPYWNQKVVSLPANVFATFYVDDKSKLTLAVLLNNNEKDLSLRLPVDWKALGYADPSRLTVDDAVFHEGASIEGGLLVTPVGRANMRLLAIQGK